MKRTVSLILAFVFVFALALSVSPAVYATALTAEAPEHYLWMTTSNGVTPSITFTLPESLIPDDGTVTLRARVRFGTDVYEQEHGSAYVNCYAYSDVEHIGNFKYLINFVDFAKSNAYLDDSGGTVKGSWVDFTYEVDPGNPSYALGREDTQVVVTDGRAVCRALNVSVGYYIAEGTIEIASVSAEVNGRTVWSVDFSAFDPLAANTNLYYSGSNGISADTKDVNWGFGVTETPPPAVIRGDMNNDGALSSDDAIFLLRHVLFGEEYTITQDGDLDLDGNVLSSDAILLLRCILFPDDYFALRTVENVALGKKYTAKSRNYRSDSYGDFNDSQGIRSRFKLTDGYVADKGDSSRIAGYETDTLSVIIDLEHTCLIKEANIDLWGGQNGVSTPDIARVTYYVSDDGIEFTKLGTVRVRTANLVTVGDWKKGEFTLALDDVRARFLRADITVSDHVWASELTVSGFELTGIGNLSDIPKIYVDTSGVAIIKDEYRSCSITVYDPTGKYATISDPNATIKVRGNSTSSGAKQPFNIKFDKKQNVFGFGKCKKWYLIANMYDKTQIRNKLAYDLADAIGMAYVQQSEFVELYVNGVYRGMYMLCESIGAGDTRVDIDVEGNEFLFEFEPWAQYSNPEWFTTPRYGIILGLNDPESPTESQRDYMSEFFTAMEDAIHSQKYGDIAKYVDLQSFVDAFIVQEFFKQVDYGTSSTRFYLKDGMLYEGPVWDFDLSAGNCSSSYYTGYNNVGGSGLSWQGRHCYAIWNSRLFRVPQIMDMVKARYLELQPYIINIYQDNELGKNQMDILLEKYRKDIDRNYTLWYTDTVYSVLEKELVDGTYDAEIEYLRDWFENRNEWMLEDFGLN